MNNIKTRLFNTVNEESLKESADIIKSGGIVAFPTETVYGLGADALNPNAIEKIFLAKGRPNDNPLIIHIHNISVLDKYVKEIPSVLTMLSKLYMPGPLTVVLKKKDIIPNNVTAGLDTVAVRIPDNEIALKLIEYSNTPIAAPSANISGRPSPTMYEHVVSDLFGKADAIINGGKTRIGLESTVLDLTTEIPVILRPGGVSYESLKLILTDVETAYSFDTEKPKSPGMKYKHYAPIADMVIVKGKTDDVV
ncbi:MAG: threonylcarbamoyl-AMP synthase, partial [Clostridiaceae bacterium]|nr:threonylcarbamoyl-AMP synthase [Clostridiaceae bacterium]